MNSSPLLLGYDHAIKSSVCTVLEQEPYREVDFPILAHTTLVSLNFASSLPRRRLLLSGRTPELR